MLFQLYVRTTDGCALEWTRSRTDDMGLITCSFEQWKCHPNFVGGQFVLVCLYGSHLVDLFGYGEGQTPGLGGGMTGAGPEAPWLH